MGSRLRSIVFAYHDIGVACLGELLRSGDDVALVVTHDDRPEENVWFGSVRKLARGHGLPVIAPSDVNAPDVVERVRACEPDFLFSFMFRRLLSRELLDVPKRGALNLHPSALPKFRGRCPINWVLVEGERETGVTLHYMVEKPDRGDIVGQRRFPIAEEDTALTLHRRATEEARLLFREVYPLLREGRAARTPQDASQASYYGGRRPEDGEIDWNWPARRIYNLVRAVTHPYPGAFTTRAGQRVFLWWARPEPENTLAPGIVRWDSGAGVFVGAGSGSLRLERVQTEGEVELQAEEWAKRTEIRSGERLGG
jgi:methionyl-tRNA formyltransferase